MDKLPDNFIQKLSALKSALMLTSNEAQTMRESLSSYADMHAAVTGAGTRAVRSPFSYSFFYSRAFVSVALIILLIVGTGSGVTYAAGNSLPGQTLYPVKVDIAEPIQGAVIAVTSGTEGSADWQNTLAERRLGEASTLAAENNLASSTEIYLTNQAAIHVAQSEDDSAKLAAAGDTSGANDVRTNLAARLAAHAELLALIAPRLAASGDASTTSQVALLLNSIQREQISVLFNPDSGEGTTTSSSTVSSSSTDQGSTTVTLAIAPTAASSTFHTQEAHFFAQDVHILSLLPVSSTSSSTASTSLSKLLKNRKHPSTATTTPAGATTTVTVTATTTADFPASGSDSGTTTLHINLTSGNP